MSARTTRTRLLAATAITIATLALTACNSDDGTQDEGASATLTDNPSEGETTDGDQGADSATGSQGSAGSTGSTGATDSTGSQDSGSGNDTGSSRNAPCDGSNTETTATEVSRPVNHLLLTVTNTGPENCDLLNYPILRFEGAQSVPPVFEDSKPQAVVTLAPGESGYAGVLLASADGSGENHYTAQTLEVFFHDGDAESAAPSLPEGGVSFDDTLTVTYWQQHMDDALTW
ncbi:DUF4232 domain-containing protein [Streptomyces sp. 6N223]|uniref:DUF4232 domain-containing protein n=1 Tax=Streptomyces sp. 6N223 TaxID=3457412 RepID=UPI003FD0DAEE